MGSPARKDALAELERRQTERLLKHVSTPHWTVKAGFLVALVTLVFAVIAAWPVIRDWIPQRVVEAPVNTPRVESITPTPSP